MSERATSVHDSLTYVAKVWLAGLAAAVMVPLALVAAMLDVLGVGHRLVPRVLRASARMEAAIDVHGEWTDIQVRDRMHTETSRA